MELTTALPVRSWYEPGPDNDLQPGCPEEEEQKVAEEQKVGDL